jgi:hypothetical protein
MNLSREGRLTHVQALSGASKSASIDYGREGTQMPKVHADK